MTFNSNLNPEDITSIVHQKSTEILMDTGFCVPDKEVLARLSREGFLVDQETQMVQIPGEIMESALAALPKQVQLYDRSGIKPAHYQERSCFMGAGTPVNVLDLESGERRPATRNDVRQLVKLQDALPHVDIVRPTVTATDQGWYSDLVEIIELLSNTDKPIVHRVLAPERVDAAFEILAAVAGGADEFRAHPNFATLYCPISPGYFTPENIRCMLRWAELGVPITLLSMAMGGASAPVTLLGELVVINTDILAWIAVLQILYPGTPLLYGSVSAVLDMRTGLLALGAPERGMVNSGAALMGHHYGLPSMCGGLSSDAKQLDAQAGVEKVLTALPLLQARANIIYGVGAVDAGSSISYSQMILDNEIIASLTRMLEGIGLHDLDEEVELIKKNTPKGNFLKEAHTRENYPQHWQPQLFSRDTYETWQDKNTTLAEVCQTKARSILEEHQPQPLPANIEAEIESIMRRFTGSDFSLELESAPHNVD
jgi:trimethylamine--corrinoid protein Co-methyltransferase